MLPRSVVAKDSKPSLLATPITRQMRVSAASERSRFKDRNGRNISQMPPMILSDDDETDDCPERPRFRVIVLLPEWVGRLIDKLVRRWIGARRG